MTTSFPRTKLRATKVALLCAVALPALMALTPAAAKTLVYCSEASPENFAPSINTTGTSFETQELVEVIARMIFFDRHDEFVHKRSPSIGCVHNEGHHFFRRCRVCNGVIDFVSFIGLRFFQIRMEV